MDSLKSINAEDKIEVYLDGGVRRGSGIITIILLLLTMVLFPLSFIFSLPSLLYSLFSSSRFCHSFINNKIDIFKALAMGAKAVGVGRPVLHGLAAYGQQGVERVIDLLRLFFIIIIIIGIISPPLLFSFYLSFVSF